jgi:hypothetical protein
MDADTRDFGKLIAVFGLAPAHLQRAVFITVLSFLFFLGTMVVYYVRPHILYFFLSSGFLIVYLVTFLGVFLQRRTALKIFEHGFTYNKAAATWRDVLAVDEEGITTHRGERVAISKALEDRDRAMSLLRAKVSGLT